MGGRVTDRAQWAKICDATGWLAGWHYQPAVQQLCLKEPSS